MKVNQNILPYSLGSLAVTSADGTEYGDTLISVTGEAGDTYYKVGATVQAVSYLQPIDISWNVIADPADITATTGQIITVVDTDASSRIISVGYATINSRDVKLSIAELAKIHDNDISVIPYATTNNKTGVEEAILGIINTDPRIIASGFTATIAAGSTYVSPTWTGKITVTDNDTALDTTTDASNRVLTMLATPNESSGKLAGISEGNVNPVPFGTENTKLGIETAMAALADADVGAGYTATILTADSSYTPGTGAWAGKFKVVDDAQALAYSTDASNREYTITIAANGSIAKLAAILEADVNPVANGTDLSVQVDVEAQLSSKADTDVGVGYTASLTTVSYDTDTHIWIGKFTVVDDTNPLATATDAENRTYTITAAGA